LAPSLRTFRVRWWFQTSRDDHDHDRGFALRRHYYCFHSHAIVPLHFTTIHTNNPVLSNAQVAVILQASAESATNRDEELNQIYQKTHSYVNRFNLMTNAEKQRQEIVDELDNLQEYVYNLCCCL
jgi:DNA-directed RNA polymerase subunit F